jgi:hypothetical protein
MNKIKIMNNQFIYIITNEAMPGLVKIGMTDDTLESRLRSLYSSGVPLPFQVYHASRVNNMVLVEKRLHDAFEDFRINKNREFFKISPERVLSALLLAEIEDVTPNYDVVENKEDSIALEKIKSKKTRFNFDLVNIKPGEKLTFVRDENITCEVVDSRSVNFEDRITSLSEAAFVVLKRFDPSRSDHGVAGPEYWEYNGEILNDLKNKILEDEE